MGNRKSIRGNTVKKRLKLWEKQKGKCVYCERETWVAGVHAKGKNELQATIEHVIPIVAGGANAQTNLACSCISCNKLRGPYPHDDFSRIRKLDNWSLKWRQYRSERPLHLHPTIGRKMRIANRNAKRRAFNHETVSRIAHLGLRTVVYL